ACGERGGYGPPDHVRAHPAAVAAVEPAGYAARYPAAGPAGTPATLYYSVFPRSAMQRFGERMREAGIEVPFARQADEAIAEGLDPPFGVADERVTTTLDVSGYVGAKRESLEAHATQMGPEQFIMRLPRPLF